MSTMLIVTIDLGSENETRIGFCNPHLGLDFQDWYTGPMEVRAISHQEVYAILDARGDREKARAHKLLSRFYGGG